MTDRKRGLGRGLGALIPTGPEGGPAAGDDAPGAVGTLSPPAGSVSRETAETASAPEPDLVSVDGARFAEIPIAGIRPNARQPRGVFDEEPLAELVASIREVGLLQPIVVRALPSDGSGTPNYELVMGERRWRASEAAGLTHIPAIVRETRDEAMLRDALLENLHRVDLNPLEEAAAYQQLLDDFGCTHDELSMRIGRSRPQITNTLRLLKLPPTVQRRVAAGVLSAGHARALLGLSDGGAQERLAQRIVAEGLSVRAVEEIVTMGADDAPSDKPVKKTGPKPTSPRLEEIASALSERLDTRVKVDLGRRKGKVTIEFASIDDLERIVTSIATEE